MDHSKLQKHIAETGYNVGYTAKLHFASFELIEKLPGLLSFISLAFGVYALAFAELSTKFASCTLLVLGMAGLYISLKNNDKSNFEQKGIVLTGLFNDLKHLMSDVSSGRKPDDQASEELKEIETRYNSSCASHHIMFATWFAHYKFFWEQQTQWIEEYRPFSFWRDKVPLTLWFTLIVIALLMVFRSVDLIRAACQIPTLVS